jgi:hypothetical protein
MVNGSGKHHHIFELHLVDYGHHVLEQIRRATCDLDPGTHVRIHTGRTMPPIWGIIIPSPLDESWFRSDLTWGWVIDQPRHYKHWQTYTSHFKVGK